MSDFLLLNEKRSINRSSIPGKPFWLPFYISEAPLASFFAYLVGFYLSELVASCANCCSKCYYCCECNS